MAALSRYFDNFYAHLINENIFGARQQWRQSDLGTISSNQWTLGTLGNTYRFTSAQTINLIEELQDGTTIKVINAASPGNYVTFNFTVPPVAGFLSIKSEGLETEHSVSEIILAPGMTAEFTQIEGVWWVTSMPDTLANYIKTAMTMADSASNLAASKVSVPVRGIIPYSPVGGTITNFDTTGLGTGSMTNWALCNGNNNTPDLRGRFLVGAVDIPDSGAPALDAVVDPASPYEGTNPPNHAMEDTGGEPHLKLLSTESGVAAHTHDITTVDATSGSTYINGSAGATYASEVTGGVSGGAATAASAHNNLPPYYSLVYLMRIN
jgi:hypothetical protein